MLGVELVLDRKLKTPAEELGQWVASPDSVTTDCRRINRRCLELGLSMNIVSLPSMGGVFRIAPPLVITDEQIMEGLAIFDAAIASCL